MFGISLRLSTDNRYISTGGLIIALAILLFVFLAPQTTHASVPTSYGWAGMQRTALDTGNVVDWCLNPSNGTSTSNAPDANGYLSYDYVNQQGTSQRFMTNQSDYCDDTVTNKGLPSAIANRSDGYRMYAIFGTDRFNGSITQNYWIDSTGDEDNYTTTGYPVSSEAYSYGGVTYHLFNLGANSGLATSSGNLGLYTGILGNTTNSDNIKLYALLYDNVDLMQIDNAVEMKEYMDALFGVIAEEGDGNGEVIPDSSEDYIVITEPDHKDNKPYTVNIEGQLNLTGVASGTKSYAITFLSQTNQDYSHLNIYATTSSYIEETFYHSVTFPLDDVIYVKAYLYDNSNWNALGLKYVSREYEWWVSAAGNPTSVVDLGTYRTGTSTCGYSATADLSFAQGFAWGLCQVGRALFVPSETTLNNVKTQLAVATSTAPFSYVYDTGNYFDTLFTVSTTTWSIVMPTSTGAMAGVVLMSSSQIQSVSFYNQMRNVLTWVVYLMIPLYAWRRSTSIFGGGVGEVNTKAT